MTYDAAPPPAEAPGRLATRPIHDGRIVHLSIDTVRFPDGSVGELEMIRHSGAAAVLPILGARTESDPEVLLIRQYRYASDGYLYEAPAGRPDAARRGKAAPGQPARTERVGRRRPGSSTV